MKNKHKRLEIIIYTIVAILLLIIAIVEWIKGNMFEYLILFYTSSAWFMLVGEKVKE